MADALLSASLQVLFDRLASPELINFIRRKNLSHDLLNELKRKLVVVHKVLNDAEMKQFSDAQVKQWLVQVKDAVYHAEDLLDEIATEALRCEMEGADSQTGGTHQAWNWNKVPAWVKAPFATQSMESRMKEMITKLETFTQEKVGLGPKEGGGEKPSPRLLSSSLVGESSIVYGRDEIKEEMVNWLLSDNVRGSNIEVMSIVGMGGSGKTTLSQYLYNHATVKEHFELKRQLEKSVGNKKLLLVLDDVWDVKSLDWESWDRLRTPLLAAAEGSKIVVTTRSEIVAKLMGAVSTHRLGELSPEDSWALFTKFAFPNGDSSAYPQLEPIGRKIVDKCQGLPLALKALGTLLYSKAQQREWEDILNSKTWHSQSGHEILPSLRLSYLHLSPPVKRCFAYCSIFPKDYEFDKEKLILLWMAEGLLHAGQSDERMKEKLPNFTVGKESGFRFGELWKLSEIRGRLEISKMENVVGVEDALQANMKDKKYLDELSLNWSRGISHDAIQDDILNRLTPHPNLKKLSIQHYPGLTFPDWLGDGSFSNLVSLQLSNCGNCSTLPPLGQLPCLEHIKISKMSGVVMVGSEFYGNSSSSLHPSFPSLQTLSFEDMFNWEKWLCCGEFPRLQELSIRLCPKLTGELPMHLSSLQELNLKDCSQLLVPTLNVLAARELQLKRQTCGFTASQTSKIEISNVSQLKQLPLVPHYLYIRKCDSVESLLEEEILQTNICHHPVLENLTISGDACDSLSLSFSILDFFPRLTNLHVFDLEGLEELCISISEGDPTSLRQLKINGCPNLVYIQLPTLDSIIVVAQKGFAFQPTGSCNMWLQPTQVEWDLQKLTSLTRFTINGGCEGVELFPKECLLPSSLTHLSIANLPNLKSLDNKELQQLTSLRELWIENCPELQFSTGSVLQRLISLKKLGIYRCGKLQSLIEAGLHHLTTLETLILFNCPNLQYLTKERLPDSLSYLRGFSGTAWERGVGFSGTGVGSDGKIFPPASLKRYRICQNHWLSPNFFAFFLATVSSTAFVGEMLCNSVRFNWLACPAATKLEMGSGEQKGEGFPARGFQQGRRARGFQRGCEVLLAGPTTVGGKKKKEVESDDSKRTV
ncbi:putative disease resistance protein At3g14460 [Vitis riparia]|uniref:putative disease resistance protein At3g14460 n=1 Tax=Vitis riparia TaxID=96939 RepID=UPI00155A431A|nr:putative disease resistance protein At3g14460 [Vitis riparia]